MTAVGTRAKHSAPGQYLGFGLQPIRLCYRLLTQSQSDRVSLEHVDDVAVHGADGSRLLEQTKSALSQNPLTDWAEDLWKAVANWIDTTAPPGAVEPPIKYHLYVVPPKTIGAFAAALDSAETDKDVAALVVNINAALNRRRKPPECLPYLNKFLQASKAVQERVVLNMRIQCSDSDPVDPIRRLLELTVAPEVIDSCCSYAIGEAKRQAEELMRQGQPGVINAGIFQAQFRNFVTRNNLPLLLTFSPIPNQSHVTAVLSQRPVFIRQLELIDASAQQQMRSVGDYLRASADKTHWAEAGVLFKEVLNDWDDGLLSQHTAICDELSITNSHLPVKARGALVYARSRQVRVPLDTKEVPEHFIHGCFHDLSDRRRLGWHPDFDSLLGNDEHE